MKAILDYILGKVYAVSPHGQPVLVLVLAATVIFALISGTLAFLALCVGIFVIAVYADHPRSVPKAAGAVLSPIDGYVLNIVNRQGLPLMFDKNNDQGEHFARLSMRQSFRLCRVLRAPVTGKIVEVLRVTPDDPQKSDGPNWRQMDGAAILFADEFGHETALVIRGVLAPHQIVLGVQADQGVTAGDRLGLMRFFGTVDLYMPDDAPLAVAPGHTLVGGETVITSGDMTAPDFRTA